MVEGLIHFWNLFVHRYDSLAEAQLHQAEIKLLREEMKLDRKAAEVQATRDTIARLRPIVDYCKQQKKNEVMA